MPALGLAAVSALAGCTIVIGPQQSTRALPPVESQVRLAQEAGPGFLDDCPLKPGRVSIKMAVDLPGNPTVPATCVTSVDRRGDADIVTFAAHWDGRRLLHRRDTYLLVYSVPRDVTPTSGSPAQLIKQSGAPPP